MSDPVTSMDVEDVLSSIRRLVSEEAKNAGAREDIHQAAEDAADQAFEDVFNAGEDGEAPEGVPPSNEVASDDSAPPQKLVLTAALRVAEPEASGSAVGDGPAERPARRERSHLRSIGSDETADSIAGFTPQRSSAFDRSPEDFLFDRARRAMEGKPDEDENDLVDEDDAETSASTEAAPSAWVSPFSDLGNILKPHEIHPVNETSETASPAPEQPEEADRNQPGDEVHAAPESDQAEPWQEPEQAADDADSGEQGSHEDDHSDEARLASSEDWQDDPHHGKDDHVDHQGHDDGAEPVNLVEEESILDEETLREMVSEMVREELQGELGDRITRNVRKLVRREIQRAIATREFE